MKKKLATGQKPDAGTVDPVVLPAGASAAAAPVVDAAPISAEAPVVTEAPIAAERMVAAATPAEPSVPVAVSSPIATGASRGRRVAMRFALAFAFGLLAVLAVSAGALAAYESSNSGRILPGVHVGSVDLSGLGPSEAAARLRSAFGVLGNGTLTLRAGDVTRDVSYDDLGRRLDVEAIVAQALAVGRDGPAIERLASNVRILVKGVDIAPQATIEGAALRFEIAALATKVAAPATNASVSAGTTGFVVTSGSTGRSAEIDAALQAAEALLEDPAAPAAVSVTLPVSTIEPDVSTSEATAAKGAADRIATDITLVQGSESWTIHGTDIQGWISFSMAADGSYRPVVAKNGLETGLAAIAKNVAIAPINATFLIGNGKNVIGVTGAKEGRALDLPATEAALVLLIDQRSQGLSVSRVAASLTVVEPELTTAEATRTAPLMAPISEWTTYFPIGVKNGYGANIWIPARDIDGQVVLPGQWFDFWKAIGPVTREHGYKDGGAIINGHTEPQGALAGGICSCSTTMFNAALRAGLEMGARANHYYYINRYPIGLDATVFASSSGSVQTMSWRNDTNTPILIRSYRWHVGSSGYVKFQLWSAPTGRTVSISKAIIKNVKLATDTTVYTTTLVPGVRNRVEYPVDGKDVWVTVTVRDAALKIIHETTYYSHYSRVTGILQIGAPKSPTPPPTPPPSPSPSP